jgi:hypothetical protein
MTTTPAAAPPQPLYRHPLGLPAGTVRSTLVLMIVGLFWLMMLLPEDKFPGLQVPLYLYVLLGLVLLFFVSHGKTIGHGVDRHSPWYLPRGFFRWILVLGTLAVVGWAYHTDPVILERRLTPTVDQLPQWPRLLLALGGGFFLGWLMQLGAWRNSPWFQDIQAWISLLAMLGLLAEVVIRLFIDPSLGERLNLPNWECILTAIVALYFGVRS